MSSGDEDYDAELNGAKKRRIQRACDCCRRKKIRCDGGRMDGNRCSNCIAFKNDCTYLESAKRRGPPKAYVESLENRLEKLEALLAQLRTEGGSTQDTSAPPPSGLASTPVNHAKGYVNGAKLRDLDDSLDEQPPPSDDEKIWKGMKGLTLNPSNSDRFYGKSSSMMLVQRALAMKSEYAGKESPSDITRLKFSNKRDEFWSTNELYTEPPPSLSPYTFPPTDLMSSLVRLYFEQINVSIPLLHWHTFQKGIEDHTYLIDDGFGAVLLIVCALGSKFSEDPRVLLDDTDSRHSAGWRYFQQVQIIRKSLLAPPRLYDLQLYSLSVMFLSTSSAPQSSWTMVGIGIRLAQDVGAHRRRTHRSIQTADDELWKRAVWVLVYLDRYTSSGMGRPCAMQDEDFDLDLPADCDDEFWEVEDPEKRFKQPPGRPSLVAAFIAGIKLQQILAFALRTIYSINKSKILLGFVGTQWEQNIVSEIDSALNKWVDSIPGHLKWDPTRENTTFFKQSAILYINYYHVQIVVHRPFIPSPRKPSAVAFPSLAICTNAARSTSHIVDIHRRRQIGILPFIHNCVFNAGIVLLLNIWGGKRASLSINPTKEMEDVHKCMRTLKEGEKIEHPCGRKWDVLYELASVGDLPLPASSPPNVNKRSREPDSPVSSSNASPTLFNDSPPSDAWNTISFATAVDELPDFCNSSQSPTVNHGHTQNEPQLPPAGSHRRSIPVYSNELGTIPLHTQADPGQNLPTESVDFGTCYPEAHTSIPNAPSDLGATFAMDSLFYEQLATTLSASAVGSLSDFQSHPQLGQYQAPPTGNSSDQHPTEGDTFSMWTNAPAGFELDDWGNYISNMNNIFKSNNR